MEERIKELAEWVINLIDMIDNPPKRPYERTVVFTEEYNNLTKDDLNELRINLETVKILLHGIYQSSKHKKNTGFRHLDTYNSFYCKKRICGGYENLKEAYSSIEKYIELPAISYINEIILKNIKR